jgi:hypothetical protein
MREKALAHAADKRCCHEAATCIAASAELALAKERSCHEVSMRAALSAASFLADKRRRHEAAKHAATLVELALANEQCRHEAAKRAAMLAELVLSEEQRHHEAATQTAMTAESSLANEQCCHEAAARVAALAELSLAKERHKAVVQEKALADEANKQRRAAMQERAFTDEANNQHRAAAQEKALADEANKQRRAAARDKALANKANKQHCHKLAKRATTLATKALAKDEHNKDDNDVARQFEAYTAPLFARVDAVMAKIRAMDDGFSNWAAFGDKILAKEDDKASAPTMPPSAPPTAVLPTHHRPTTYKDAVLATMGGSLHAKSLVVAPLSCPSTTVNDQPQTSCRCSQPCCHVGCRHAPRAPNP